MRFYKKPLPEAHTAVETRFALLPTYIGEKAVWVWLERYNVLYDSYGDEYYRLP